MSFGGGFFGGGESTTKNTDRHNENTQTLTDSEGSSVNSLSNLSLGKNSNMTIGMTDYGALNKASSIFSDVANSLVDVVSDVLGSNTRAVSDAANLSFDGINAITKGVNDIAAFNYDSVNKILAAGSDRFDQLAEASYKGVEKNLDFSKSVFDSGVNQNSEFMGAVSDWSKENLAATERMQGLSLAQDRYFLDSINKENSENRVMVTDAFGQVGKAWSQATTGLMNLSSDFLKSSMVTQNEALAAIDKNSQAAQASSLKAMNAMFESTKSDVERVASDGIKYIFYGVVALVALPLIVGAFKK